MSNGEDARDRLVVATNDDGVMMDMRTGQVLNPPPRHTTWAQRIAARRTASGSKPVVPTAPKAEKQWGKPTASPRDSFDPRANDICSEVIPKIDPSEMNGREWVRHEVLCDLAEPIGIWVLISAIGRGGNKQRCIVRATQQMALEALKSDTIRVLFRWALTFGVYPIGILEGGSRAGDVERWENIAYRLLEWAKVHNHPLLPDLKTVYRLNRILPKAPDGEVEQIDVDYREIEQIAIDVGIDPIAIRARETAPIARPQAPEAPKPETEPVAPPAPVEEDTGDEVTASPGTNVVTIEEKVEAVTPEPPPDVVAKHPEAPKPSPNKAVIISAPSNDERILAEAVNLANAKGHDYHGAAPMVRSYYRKEAKRKLGL